MRFLADMGLSLRVVEWLRKRGDDVVHLREQGLQRLADEGVFEKASAETRVLLTFDLAFGEIVALSRESRTSVVLFRLRNTRTHNVITRLERVLAESSDALARGAVVIVEDDRHRVRSLPVGGESASRGPSEVREVDSERSSPAPAFTRYIGIDYSGAKTPTDSLSGLRVYLAEADTPAREELPPPGPRRYWTRRGLAEWLVLQLQGDRPTLVGMDHAFSFPLAYFEHHRLAHDWPAFLEDFRQHWPTDEEHMYVDFVRDGLHGNGKARGGDSRWRRLTERRTRSAKSVFHFDVQGSVAKSTHAGLPWLRHLRQQLGQRAHFWPFDGWEIRAGMSAVVEIFPTLWRKAFPTRGLNPHQHDAYSAAEWMRRADREGTLGAFLRPRLSPADLAVAAVEGWILGVE